MDKEGEGKKERERQTDSQRVISLFTIELSLKTLKSKNLVVGGFRPPHTDGLGSQAFVTKRKIAKSEVTRLVSVSVCNLCQDQDVRGLCVPCESYRQHRFIITFTQLYIFCLSQPPYHRIELN